MQVAMRGDGKLLAAKRLALKWSRDRLARELDSTAKTVENHEKGKYPITHEQVLKYARALGCRPEDISQPELVDVSARRPAAYPAPVVELLRARRHLDIEPDELAELSRYVTDGLPSDVDSLELELLTQRARRNPRDNQALNDFAAAVNRLREAEGVPPWTPGPPAVPKLLPSGSPTKKKRA
jgi:transcriptional regulator with XRE-family HTH domain